MTTVILEGWYLLRRPVEKDSKAKAAPAVDTSTVVLSKNFISSAKRHKVVDLHITDLKHIQGSYLWPTYVRGVINVEHGLEPFFIEETRVAKLRELINSSDELRL